MAFSGGLKLVLFVISMIMLSVEAQVDQVQASFNLVAETVLEWPWTTMLPVYDHELVGDGDGNGDEEQDVGIEIGRRSLYRKAKHYYISYGALAANRVPCPARSGRSYYNHDCFKARHPANPYTRGCSTITHCRR
ncbi:hypothetical protein LWI29_034245 [Acer saccharum]|uniref:Rapid ALkalinization Factor n=1 Tax=Acer saccharum TaxID=4024 RepID=A0AA39VG98_ACESA|nr:hypothetical protein LWI29_034245 [Acer saccharum]